MTHSGQRTGEEFGSVTAECIQELAFFRPVFRDVVAGLHIVALLDKSRSSTPVPNATLICEVASYAINGEQWTLLHDRDAPVASR